jgi:hypothetical protein
VIYVSHVCRYKCLLWYYMMHHKPPAKHHMKSELSRGSSISPDLKKDTWVQTERKTHEAWGQLTKTSPRAAALAHFLVANMDRTGALVAAWATLADLTGMSPATVRRAADDLKAGSWIEVVQIGGKGGANAFVINSRVAWSQTRDRLPTARFTAQVLAARGDQQQLADAPLRRLPLLRQDELQLPTGPGEDPPAQPSFPGLEPDLPAVFPDDDDLPYVLSGPLRFSAPNVAEMLAKMTPGEFAAFQAGIRAFTPESLAAARDAGKLADWQAAALPPKKQTNGN